MELFGTNYLNIRNNYLLPKLNFGITRKKIEYWSFKDIITSKLISLNKRTGKSIEIELPIEDYYKAIHSDIELFMNKSVIQYSDFRCQKKGVSPSWSFVTLYYLAFFSTTCLFRFLDKGFIFLSREHVKKLEDFSLIVHSNPISLDTGNYYFSFKEVNLYGNVVLIFSFKGESVHKSTWLQLEATLREFNQNCDANESAIYNFILDHFSKFSSEFPSNLRNRLNYNGDSSLLDLENIIPYMDLQKLNSKFLKELAEIDATISNNSNQMNSVGFLVSYLFELNQKLYSDFLERSSYGKDFDKERRDYLKLKQIVF